MRTNINGNITVNPRPDGGGQQGGQEGSSGANLNIQERPQQPGGGQGNQIQQGQTSAADDFAAAAAADAAASTRMRQRADSQRRSDHLAKAAQNRQSSMRSEAPSTSSVNQEQKQETAPRPDEIKAEFTDGDQNVSSGGSENVNVSTRPNWIRSGNRLSAKRSDDEADIGSAPAEQDNLPARKPLVSRSDKAQRSDDYSAAIEDQMDANRRDYTTASEEMAEAASADAAEIAAVEREAALEEQREASRQPRRRASAARPSDISIQDVGYSETRDTNRKRSHNVEYDGWKQVNPDGRVATPPVEFEPDTFDYIPPRREPDWKAEAEGSTIPEERPIIEERDTSKRDASVKRITANLQRGYFTIKGGWNDNIKKEIDRTLSYFQMERKDEKYLLEAVQLVLGYSVDRNGKIFGIDVVDGKENVGLTSRQVIEALRDLRRNTDMYGHPFVYSRPDLKFGDSYRFPITFGSPELALAFTNSNQYNPLRSMTVADFQKRGMDEWRNRVYPAAKANAKPDQMNVLLDMVRAVSEMNSGISEESWNYLGLSIQDYYTLDEYLDSLNDYAVAYGKAGRQNQGRMAEVSRIRNERIRRATDNLYRNRSKGVRDDNGNFTNVEDCATNSVEWFLRTVVNASRFMSVVGDVPLMLGNIIEKVDGSTRTFLTAKLLNMEGGPTKNSKTLIRSNAAVDALEGAKLLMQKGGADAMYAYLGEGNSLNSRDASVWSNTNIEPSASSNPVAMKVNEIVNKASAISGRLMSGDFVMRTADAGRWLDFYIYEVSKSDMNITPEQIEQMLMVDPVKFVDTAMTTPEGFQAFIKMLDSSVGGTDPMTGAIDNFFRQHGLSETAFSIFIDKFWRYGIRTVGRWMPLTHSGVYIASYVANRKRDLSGDNDINDTFELAIGANAASFSEGLKQNFLFDLVGCATRLPMALIVFGVFSMLGTEEPDDPDKVYCWDEWKINGLEAIKLNWWLRDIPGFMAPLGVAAAAYGKTKDASLAWKIFNDGCQDTMDGTVIMDMLDIVMNFDREVVDAQNTAYDKDSAESPDGIEFYTTQVLTWGTRKLVELVEPRFVRSLYNESYFLGEDNLARSKGRRFTPDPTDDPMATEQVGWSEQQWRSTAYDSPLMGAFLNFINGTWISDGTQKTGYTKYEMPLIEQVDPINLTWSEELSLEPDDTDERKQEVVNKVISIMETYDGNAAKIAADGIVIPYEARNFTDQYIKAKINMLWNEYNDRVNTVGEFSNNGLSYYENQRRKNEFYNDTYEQVNYWNNLLDNTLWENSIPYSPYVYNRWETDYETRYVWKDSGEPATRSDYLNPLLNYNVDVVYYASGDHKSSIVPFLQVDNRWNTYDAQTPVAWYDSEYTNMEDLERLYAGMVDAEGNPITVPSGANEGMTPWEVLTGDGAVLQGDVLNWDQIPVFGQRAHIAENEPYVDVETIAYDAADLWTGDIGEAGLYKDADSFKSNSNPSYGSGSYWGGYSSGRSYSFGGSGYNPKIYSNPAYSLSSDRPSTMYSKIPNSTYFDYIRPDFQTQGSRYAYSRSEI